MTVRRTLPLFVCALVAAVAATTMRAPAAQAKTPCWKQLINDWYDGTIDKTYPVHCYREARQHIPQDAQVYSSLPSDLDRALAAALAGNPGGPLGPDTPVTPVPGTGRKATPTSTTGSTSTTADGATTTGEDKGSGVLDWLAPANADSIPLPLLILAGLAVLLLAAAAASFVARRVQARRVPATAPRAGRTARR